MPALGAANPRRAPLRVQPHRRKAIFWRATIHRANDLERRCCRWGVNG